MEEQKDDHLEYSALVVEERDDHLECSAWWAVCWVGLVGGALALAVLEAAEAWLVEGGAAQTEFGGAAQTEFGDEETESGDEARGAGEGYRLVEKELVRMGQSYGETAGFFW